MATVHHDSKHFSVLEKYFSPTQRDELVEEDLLAGKSVSALLFLAIGGGALVGILAVIGIVIAG